MNWDLFNVIMTVAAFLMSAISLIWQLASHYADLKLDILGVYKNVSDLGPQYIFRMHFINNSPTAVSISRIFLKNGNDCVEVSYSKQRLIKVVHRNISTKKVDGKTESTQKITDKGRLYSHELPFRVEGYGVEGGDFHILDKEDKLKISGYSTLKVIVCTNKKNIEFEIPVNDIFSWDDFDVCLD